MKHILSILFVALISTSIFAQNDTAKKEGMAVWKTLSKITFKMEKDEFMGFKVKVPVFSKEVLALDGKEITVRGYIIPVEGYKNHKTFVFSLYPYNMCYFCGGAGPETVMDVSAIEGIQYTADPVILKGRFELITGDINELFYSLSNAKLVSK